jgi:MFS family permease
MCGMMVGRVVAFTSIFVLISNSTAQERRGAVNGIGQAAAASGRAMSPPIFTFLFAWAASINGIWPFNHHLPWIVLAAITAAIASVAMRLPRELEQPVDAPADDAQDAHSNSNSMGVFEEETEDETGVELAALVADRGTVDSEAHTPSSQPAH